MKAFNQIDFAIAFFIMFMVVSFSMTYISNYFSRQTPPVSDDMKNVMNYMKRLFFDSKGIPEDWETMNTTPVRIGLQDTTNRIPIILKDNSGVNKTNEEIDIYLALDEQCRYNVYNNSIRLYDSFFNETNFTFYNATYCSGNYLKEANIQFLINLTGNSSKTYYLYYSNKTEPWKNYTLNLYEDSLVGYWKFDSVNASNYTLDATNNHNDGQLMNGSATCFNNADCIRLANGYRKSGLVFDGVDDYVFIGNKKTLDITNEITISAWINYHADGTDHSIAGKGTNYLVFIRDSSKEIGWYNGNPYFSSGANVLPDVWNHIVVTNNGTTAKFYKNGNYISSVNQGLGSAVSVAFAIGRDNGGSGVSAFNGTIDDVHVWNRSLSEDEIKALYNFTKPIYIKSPQVKIISDDKISGAQNLSYNEVRNSLGLKNHFNVTVCGESFGKHVPDDANVIASRKSVIARNKTGDFGTCMAEIKIW